MGIFCIKVFKRIKSIIYTLVLKIIYNSKIKLGKKVVFYPNCHVTIDGGKVFIGNNCFFNHNCSINSLSKIEIGNDCIFGESVKIYDHNHNYSSGDLIRKQGFKKKDVIIGNNCWIGSNVVILPGVKIGNNAVIGANTVVTKNILDNQIIVLKNEYREL